MSAADRAQILMEAHLNGVASVAEHDELATYLRSDAALRRRYLEYLAQESALRAIGAEVITSSARVELRRMRPRRQRPAARSTSWVGLVIAAGVLCAVTAVIWQSSTQAPTADRFLVALSGDLTLLRRSAEISDTTEPLDGDELHATGTVRVDFPDGSVVTLAAGTRVVLVDDDAGIRLRLEQGDITCEVRAQPQGFIVHMPEADVRVIGTRFRVQQQGAVSRVEVERGRVAVQTREWHQELGPGEAWTNAADAPATSPPSTQVPGCDDTQHWIGSGALAIQREARAVVFAAEPSHALWCGQSVRWHQALPTSATWSWSVRVEINPTIDTQAEIFLAEPASPYDEEGQPLRCWRLALRDGVPTVARLDRGPDHAIVLWKGPAVAEGRHHLRFAVTAGQLAIDLDGARVWTGPASSSTVVPGLRVTRKQAAAQALRIDEITLDLP